MLAMAVCRAAAQSRQLLLRRPLRCCLPCRTLHSASRLPDRVSASLECVETPYGEHGLVRSEHRLVWNRPPQNVLIIKKPNDPKTAGAMRTILKWLKDNRPDTNVIVEAAVLHELGDEHNLPIQLHSVDASETQQSPKETSKHTSPTLEDITARLTPESLREYARTVDFVVTLGGDGTILHASSLFAERVPPILSFSLGNLGFLLPFDFHEHEPVLARMFEGDVPVLQRMRFGCTIHTPGQENRVHVQDVQIMNELTVHRGKHAQLTAIDVFLGNNFLTDVIADGLIVSTPTGSTAYSLSAGGPIVHPAVEALLLTPICPRSLSFRPIVLPAQTGLKIQLSASARGHAEVTIDGRDIQLLRHGQQIEVVPSVHGIPVVSRMDSGSDWVQDIKMTLRWNQNFVGAASKLSH